MTVVPSLPMSSRSPSRPAVCLLAWGLVAVVAGCDPPRPAIIAHRSQGVGEPGENKVANMPLVLEAGFGLELDVRADGVLPFELGHNSPEGETLDEALDAIEAAWQPSFAGLPLVVDIADDDRDRVTETLVPHLLERIEGSELRDLGWILQNSSETSLGRLQAAYAAADTDVELKFGLTLWTVVEYSIPSWVDYVVTNVNELPSWPHPKPLILFGVASRASYEQVESSASEVAGVLTDHPRRIANLQGRR